MTWKPLRPSPMPRCGWREAGTRLEDRWYRVSSARRRDLVALVREKIAANLPADHASVRAFDEVTARKIRPSALIHAARVHGVRGAWRLRDWARSVYRSDAALLEQMFSIRLGLLGVRRGWLLLVAAFVLAPVKRWQARNARAEATRVAYCPQTLDLAFEHIGSTPIAVNRRGWQRVAWWRVRAEGDPDPPRTIDLFPFAVVAALVLIAVFPDQPHAGILTAALSATGVFEVRTGGNAANSGYFNPGGGSPGTDRSQSNSPHVTIDGATITATVHTTTTQLNIVGYTVSSADNRNGVRITGGTMTQGLFEIIAVDVGNNRWTLDRSGGTAAQTGTGRMGGAASSLGLVGGSVPVSGARIWIETGTYSITSATDNVNNGCFDPLTSHRVEGYASSRGDLGTPPLLQASGISTFVIIDYDGVGLICQLFNVDFDGASLTSARGIEFANGEAVAYKVSAVNFTNNAFAVSNGNLIYCVASGHSTQAGINVVAFSGITHCVSTGGTVTGVLGTTASADATIAFSLSYANTGATSDGFSVDGDNKILLHNVTYANGRDGFRSTGTGVLTLVNNIAESNDGIGINVTGAAQKQLFHNAAFDNGTDESQHASTFVVGATIIGSTSFFTNAAGGDFSLNDDAGGGADLRGAGFNVFPLGLTPTSFADIGASQSGLGGPIVSGGETGFATVGG